MNVESKYDFDKFKLIEILSNNSNRKLACLLGYFENFGSDSKALVILEKTAFSEKHLQSSENSDSGYFNTSIVLKEEFINDIYGNFHCFPKPDLNGVKTTIIYPATEKHIKKYRLEKIHLIRETGDLYTNITLPYLVSKDYNFSLDWVYNILEHKKEKERIVFEDPDPINGFILLPDLKWDGKTVETLYLIAICHKRNIKSIRDLTEEHLPLLRNIRDRGIEAIEKRYDVPSTQLRIYFHYQPSFYHLHVHFTYLKYDAPGIFCEKSHLLDTVINNIELMPAYYNRATLSFVVPQSDKLYEKFMDENQSNKRLKVTDE